jgi:hypothetical protein
MEPLPNRSPEPEPLPLVLPSKQVWGQFAELANEFPVEACVDWQTANEDQVHCEAQRVANDPSLCDHIAALSTEVRSAIPSAPEPLPSATAGSADRQGLSGIVSGGGAGDGAANAGPQLLVALSQAFGGPKAWCYVGDGSNKCAPKPPITIVEAVEASVPYMVVPHDH